MTAEIAEQWEIRSFQMHAEKFVKQLLDIAGESNQTARNSRLQDFLASTSHAELTLLKLSGILDRKEEKRLWNDLLKMLDTQGQVNALYLLDSLDHQKTITVARARISAQAWQVRSAVLDILVSMDMKQLSSDSYHIIGYKTQHLEDIKMLTRDPHEFVRRQALDRLYHLDPLSSLAVAATFLNDPEPMARVLALTILAKENDCQHAEAVERLCTDEHGTVRSFALSTLYKLNPERASPLLLNSLQDNDGMVQCAALDILDQHPELMNYEDLLLMVENIDLLARRKLLRLLAKYGDERI